MEPTDRSLAALSPAVDGTDLDPPPRSRRPYVAPCLVRIDLTSATQIKSSSQPEGGPFAS
jgi:hypothetical protein